MRKTKQKKTAAANILADLLMLLPYLGPFIAVIRCLLLVFFCCFECFFPIWCTFIVVASFYSMDVFMCPFYRRYSPAQQRIQYTGWCKSLCVHYHCIWPVKKWAHWSKISFIRAFAAVVVVSHSFIEYGFYNFFHICFGSRVGSYRDCFSIDPKTFMNVMQLRATIANLRARESERSAAWIGNFSVHEIKVLAGKPNIIIEWRPLQMRVCIRN